MQMNNRKKQAILKISTNAKGANKTKTSLIQLFIAVALKKLNVQQTKKISLKYFLKFLFAKGLKVI